MKVNYKKKRILLLVPTLQGGGQERVCALTADLLKDRYDVWVVLFDDSDILYHTEVPIINICMPSKQDRCFSKVLRALTRSFAVRKIKKKKEITHAISFGESANLINVLSKIGEETISGIHGNMQIESGITNRIIIPFSKRIIAVSQEMTYELKKRFPKKQIIYIPNPVDLEEIQKKGKYNCKITEKTHEFKLYTMGRIVWEKGYWHLLKACSCLCKRGYDIELIHAGSGDTDSCKRLAKELLIDDRIIFKGQLENPFCEMKNADVFVLSSCSEGLPNVILEAMAMELPVVSTNCKTGPASILQDDWQEAVLHRHEVFMADYGILAPEVGRKENMNAEEIENEDLMLADAIEEMLKNRETRELYRQRSLLRAKDFSKERYLDKVVACLE